MGKKEVGQKNSSTGSLVGGREERGVERFRRENPLHRNLTYLRAFSALFFLLPFIVALSIPRARVFIHALHLSFIPPSRLRAAVCIGRTISRKRRKYAREEETERRRNAGTYFSGVLCRDAATDPTSRQLAISIFFIKGAIKELKVRSSYEGLASFPL